ncbi:MAG: hypothetical protein NTW19_05425 [Planctomycetota bacterium]|nr:hypothetical protein [Planctomycetota bacterium]
MRNEAGTVQIDVLKMSDHLARHLTNAANLDVLPVNRTLAAMEALQLSRISTPSDALLLMDTLHAEGLVVGSITAYDPYDPPKIGMTLELYQNPRVDPGASIDVRKLTRAATDNPGPGQPRTRQPVSAVSAYLDSADSAVRHKVQRYAFDRGGSSRRDDQWLDNPFDKAQDDEWRLYRISTDLYSEFVTYVMSWRLLRAETQRLAPPPPTPPAR